MIQTSSNQPKIFTFATVAIPNGKGGVAETFKVEVPAFRNTETGIAHRIAAVGTMIR